MNDNFDSNRSSSPASINNTIFKGSVTKEAMLWIEQDSKGDDGKEDELHFLDKFTSPLNISQEALNLGILGRGDRQSSSFAGKRTSQISLLNSKNGQKEPQPFVANAEEVDENQRHFITSFDNSSLQGCEKDDLSAPLQTKEDKRL